MAWLFRAHAQGLAQVTEKLRLHRDQFMAFAFASGDLLIETDREGVIAFAVGASNALLGRAANELLGLKFEDMVVDADRALVHHLIRVIAPGARRGPLAIELETPSGVRPATINAFMPWDRQGAIDLSVCAGHYQLVSHENPDERDSATGLLRKETFSKVAEDLLRRAEAASSPLSLTHIGIPGLAELGERHGADAVSEFLAEAAALLRSFAYGDAATSLTESKYAILHDATISSADIAAELQLLNEERHGDEIDLGITHRSIANDKSVSAEDATRALIYTINEFADNAEGPVGIASLNSAIETRLSVAIDRINWFKQAVIKQDLHFVGQPIVWLNGGNIHHAEVLVRFQSNQSPFGHLHFAEKVGIIHELDFSVIEYVVAYLTTGHHGRSAPMPLAVNVSAVSFERGDFVVKLMRLLENRITQPELLMFEITESTEIRSLERTNRVLQGLRKRGFRVCLDDFGAGAASFQYLRTLDVDMVKVDGHYVKTALKLRKEAEMLRAIASLCRKLQVMTVAEQVESETQADFLRDCGIDLAQGYLYAKPTPLILSTHTALSTLQQTVA